jgi:GWxTD domain-containing protein
MSKEAMKKILLIIAILIFSQANNAYAKKIFMSIDMAQFNRGDKTVVEFYYSFPDTALSFKYKDSGKYIGEMCFNVEFYDNVHLVTSEKWIFPIEIEKYDGTYKQNFFGQKEFALESGQYKVKIHVNDNKDSTTNAEIEYPYPVKKYDNSKINLSEIELVSILENKDEALRNWNKMFEKPGYFVIPNPSAIYYETPGNLLYYSELYNAKKFSPDGVIIYYKIMNAAGAEKLRFPMKKKSSTDGMLLVGEIPLDQLSTGVYYFDITAVYPPDKPTDSVTVSKKFFFSNRFKKAEQTANFIENLTFEKSEFATFAPKRVKDEIEQAAIIATESERKSMNNLNTDEAKQRFLFKFWTQRDPDTTTTLNEARAEFLKNVEYANIHFKFGKLKDGWKTDRGKILLKYGKPDQINYKNMVEMTNSYDEWVYESLFGGCRFYFVDDGGYGNYKYVHSTAPGERYNPNWLEQFVNKSNNNDSNKNPNINGL